MLRLPNTSCMHAPYCTFNFPILQPSSQPDPCDTLQGLENLLWAFATLNHRPPPDMLQLAAQRLAETLDTFNQQNLALTLWAYARFAFCPNPAIMAACTERATELAVVRHCALVAIAAQHFIA